MLLLEGEGFLRSVFVSDICRGWDDVRAGLWGVILIGSFQREEERDTSFLEVVAQYLD